MISYAAADFKRRPPDDLLQANNICNQNSDYRKGMTCVSFGLVRIGRLGAEEP